MYISLNWLKDFVKIPTKIKPTTISEGLTSHTVEVENLLNQSEQFNQVVVGRVLEVHKHPNADRLRLATVDVKSTKLKIVCGATNLAVNQLVPVSLIGVKLPNGLEIKESLIRGEKSSGMICAEDELGLGQDHEGILVLNDKAKIGESFAKYLQANDYILEIDNKSLSNRPDLLNHYGLARELSAIFMWTLKAYNNFFKSNWNFLSSKENKLEVKIEARELCPRYLALKLDNILVKESPKWLRNRLIAVNQRPVNNIVDLANYVMLDCGQPLHTFDASKIEKIVVRRADNQESIKTLDDKERILDNRDLVISNGSDIIAIAGVIGGKDSEITTNTTSIILESANFLAANIRKTSQKLGLRTEASVRFEKSLDIDLPELALNRFLTLLLDICPEMKISSSLIDCRQTKNEIIRINLDLVWLTKKLGQEIPREFVITSLKKLGFEIEDDRKDIFTVIVPSWRSSKDIQNKEDLAEEVLRLYGYDKIVSQSPVLKLGLPELNKERLLERKIKNILTLGYALNEVYNYSFVGVQQLQQMNIDYSQYLKLVNPWSSKHSLLRQSLIPGFINNIKINQFKEASLAFMEIGSVFFKIPGNLPKDFETTEVLPYQERHLGLALTGDGDLFGNLKGIITGLLQNLIDYKIRPKFLILESVPNWANEIWAAKIVIFNKEIGILARIKDQVALNFNFKKPAVLAEINFKILAELVLNLKPVGFQTGSKYPAVRRDISFVVAKEILYNDLRGEIIKFNPLIINIELFDIYQGNKLKVEQKSLAFHLVYQAKDHTLVAQEVDEVQEKLIAHLVKKFAIKLRDF